MYIYVYYILSHRRFLCLRTRRRLRGDLDRHLLDGGLLGGGLLGGGGGDCHRLTDHAGIANGASTISPASDSGVFLNF